MQGNAFQWTCRYAKLPHYSSLVTVKSCDTQNKMSDLKFFK